MQSSRAENVKIGNLYLEQREGAGSNGTAAYVTRAYGDSGPWGAYPQAFRAKGTNFLGGEPLFFAGFPFIGVPSWLSVRSPWVWSGPAGPRERP